MSSEVEAQSSDHRDPPDFDLCIIANALIEPDYYSQVGSAPGIGHDPAGAGKPAPIPVCWDLFLNSIPSGSR